jgi:hypothetical protein
VKEKNTLSSPENREHQCSEENCRNCFNYNGCVHQPYYFWQIPQTVPAFELQHVNEIKPAFVRQEQRR